MPAEYARTRSFLMHGHLEKSETDAEQKYRLFRVSHPHWALKFRLIEAESMVARGKQEDAQRIFAELAPAFPNSPEEIERLAFNAQSLSRLHRYSDANASLTQAAQICAQHAFETCGLVPRMRGVLAVEKGEFAQAHQFFSESLIFARSHHDPWLEVSSLSNLGVAALQQERYDEAADWSTAAYRAASALGDEDLAQRSMGNLGWAFFELGDFEKSLEFFVEAEKRAATLGDLYVRLAWLTAAGNVYREMGDLPRAIKSYREALILAKQLDSKEQIVNALEDLAQASIEAGKVNDAEACLQELDPLIRASGNRLDALDVLLTRGEIAAARNQDQQAETAFRAVEQDPASQTSMKLDAEHRLALLYERQHNLPAADHMYRTALTSFESARDQVKDEDSKIPFAANAADIYSDYIQFLVSRGEIEEALRIADTSRAQTLKQGLGLASQTHSIDSPDLRPTEVARKTNATLLFYWLGQKKSYLWAINSKNIALYPLPPQREIAQSIERYRKALLGIDDPAETSDRDGLALYRLLVAPASQSLPAGSNAIVLSDGPLSQLNFETLLVPAPHPHYWIEDATIVSAPSLHLLASATAATHFGSSLLLIGNAVSPNADYPELPEAASEMKQIQQTVALQNETVYSRGKATASAYLDSNPERFSYIHFVAHGVASRTDPLDSAIILSRSTAAEDSFKLHAREIIQHPIHAQLVTISACYGSGTRYYAGEGPVGLAWAFLHAGAHNVIGALWEVSDESTPQLMGNLYQGLEHQSPPNTALRQAKLTLLHSKKEFRKPFYWAPFQLYTGR
jgi:CHAT domain-containing protein